MQNTQDQQQPRIVTWLGYGGLLPFLGCALMIWIDPSRSWEWVLALRGYGAVILSFVGALHWGFAMQMTRLEEPRREALYLWSVLPSLMGFLSLVIPPLAGYTVLLVGFTLHFMRDRALSKRDRLPEWYLPLRWRLTVVACLCLVTGAILLV